MPDYGFYIDRKKEERLNASAAQNGANRVRTPTDLPEKRPGKQPADLPSPRHRPGEPILYDPPDGRGMMIADSRFDNDGMLIDDLSRMASGSLMNRIYLPDSIDEIAKTDEAESE